MGYFIENRKQRQAEEVITFAPMIKTICVCGAGTMGSGIAQVAAQAGFKTIQFDVNAAMLVKSKTSINIGLKTLINKGKISVEQQEEIISRILFTSNINDCVADVIIEAIIEKKEAKISLFNQLAGINDHPTIFASNTSSISITALGSHHPNPQQVIGMHFFNPAPIMKLVEVVVGQQTSRETVDQILELSKQFGKTSVVCKDAPGFIVNRVARQYYLEAMKLVEEGITTIEQVDELMEASGFKMGPFKLMDLIGIDINYSVSNIVWEDLGKPVRLTPSNLQQQKVLAGELGKKTSKGFYNYS